MPGTNGGGGGAAAAFSELVPQAAAFLGGALLAAVLVSELRQALVRMHCNARRRELPCLALNTVAFVPCISIFSTCHCAL